MNKDKEFSEQEPTVEINDNVDANAGAADARSEIDELRDQVAALSDKYLRARAEVENTKRRAGIDTEIAARARSMAIAENFLGLIDAIDAAVAHAPGDAGIESMALAAKAALAKNGIVRIETVGQSLNPQFHNAVSTENANDENDASIPANTITKELQPGYMFGDTVLRPAMVIVAK